MKKKKRKIFEAVGSFDYRFDYLVLSAEFSCSNNNNRSKKYIIYQQEFIVTASSPNTGYYYLHITGTVCIKRLLSSSRSRG